MTTTHLAQTDSELSLLQGESVLVHRPRPDGRVLVTQESSGQTGLFHSSVLQALERLSWLCSSVYFYFLCLQTAKRFELMRSKDNLMKGVYFCPECIWVCGSGGIFCVFVCMCACLWCMYKILHKKSPLNDCSLFSYPCYTHWWVPLSIATA